MSAEEKIIAAFIEFAAARLPELLGLDEDPIAALERIGKEWRSRRTEKFDPQTLKVAANRERVDEALASRKARKKS